MRTTSNSVLVPASPAAVWAVLTDPALTRSCLLGLAVESTFAVGAQIAFRGPGGILLGGRVLAHDRDELLTPLARRPLSRPRACRARGA